MFTNISFANAWVLYFLLLLPLMIFWYIRSFKKQSPDITFSSLKMFKGLKPGLKERLKHLPFILRTVAIAFVIVALARPQTFSTGENVYTEGIDVAMLLDISGSMLAEDFKPNRLEAAKEEIEKFIQGRTTDKIGLVIFAKESFTQCPLTIDYSVLRNLIVDIKSGMLEDGTAIGNAIANGVNRLKDSDAKSKVIILLTDGENNAGEIDPITAAQIAKEFGVRIYAIGVGSKGTAPYPVQTPFGIRYQQVPVNIDEKTLTEITNLTDGKYFRATSNKRLEEIYKEIDQLEKTKVQITSYRQAKELFYDWVGVALLLLLLELLLVKTYLRRIP